VQSGQWSKKTKENLLCLFKKHVLPIIGQQAPREVTLSSLQLLLNRMAECGYSKSAVGQVRIYIKACLEYATDEDLIPKNPARKIAMPKIQKRSCQRFLSIDEIRALPRIASQREHLVLRILSVCGLRPAEILVLRIEDFEGTQLRIDEALKELQKGEDRIGETKTDESNNYVPAPPDLGREIAAWIAAHPGRGSDRRYSIRPSLADAPLHPASITNGTSCSSESSRPVRTRNNPPSPSLQLHYAPCRKLTRCRHGWDRFGPKN
jgi:integrase